MLQHESVVGCLEAGMFNYVQGPKVKAKYKEINKYLLFNISDKYLS